MTAMNVAKMRRNLARQRPCGARYSHAPGVPIEVCTLLSTHEGPHNWPSLPTDPKERAHATGASALRMAGVSLREMAAPQSAPSTHSRNDETPHP